MESWSALGAPSRRFEHVDQLTKLIPVPIARDLHQHPAFSCTMSHATYLQSENGDGVVGFHYASDDDSEYMTIRRNPEPAPLP